MKKGLFEIAKQLFSYKTVRRSCIPVIKKARDCMFEDYGLSLRLEILIITPLHDASK
jgi:hypothetical protein